MQEEKVNDIITLSEMYIKYISIFKSKITFFFSKTKWII